MEDEMIKDRKAGGSGTPTAWMNEKGMWDRLKESERWLQPGEITLFPRDHVKRARR